jgi:hypothetical protein
MKYAMNVFRLKDGYVFDSNYSEIEIQDDYLIDLNDKQLVNLISEKIGVIVDIYKTSILENNDGQVFSNIYFKTSNKPICELTLIEGE